MNAERHLVEAYQEWRGLAETEGAAIGASDWNLVSACQAALKQLQERITRFSLEVREEWSKSNSNHATKEKVLQMTIQELIQIEHRNQTLLQELREAAKLKLDQLGHAGWNLKQLHRSYGSGHPVLRNSFL